MTISYPCQIGLPKDLHSSITGFVVLCCDHHIISQEHDGKAGIDSLRMLFGDPLIKWAAGVDRVGYHFEMIVLEKPELWIELRIKIFAGDSRKAFLEIIFRQAKGSGHKQSDLGWKFVCREESDEALRQWIKTNHPDLHYSDRDGPAVSFLWRALPGIERLRADSPFMARFIWDLLGRFSALRAV